MQPLVQLDRRYVWHPFTQMRDWVQREPIVIIEGHGSVLRDVKGRKYLDANSSIWTNLHGHGNPKIDAAIKAQLKKIAHSSALGLASGPAAHLAKKLVQMANPSSFRQPVIGTGLSKKNKTAQPTNAELQKVFFSDDGSTAMEVALKLAFEFSRRT